MLCWSFCFRRFLQKACQHWGKVGSIPKNLIQSIKSHIGTENNEVSTTVVLLFHNAILSSPEPVYFEVDGAQAIWTSRDSLQIRFSEDFVSEAARRSQYLSISHMILCELQTILLSSFFLFHQVFTDNEVFTRFLHLPLSLIVSRAALKSVSFSAMSCLTLSIHVFVCLPPST